MIESTLVLLDGVIAGSKQAWHETS